MQQTIVCALIFRPPSITGPKIAPTRTPHQGEPCGNRWPRALPLPLPFLAVGNGTGLEPNNRQREPRGWKQEGHVHHSLWWGRSRLSLPLSPPPLHLATWKPQVSSLPRHLTCGLRKGTEGHEFMCPQHRRGGGKKESCWQQAPCSLYPLCVGIGLCSQHLPEGTTWTKPRGMWAEPVKVLSCVGTRPPLCLCPSAGIQVQTLCFEAVCLCL